MINPIVIKTDKGDVIISTDDYMTCQREYDMNMNHMETGSFWEFFQEFFKKELEGARAYATDKKSPGYNYLLLQQKKWRNEKEERRRKYIAWRNNLNRSRQKKRFFDFGAV